MSEEVTGQQVVGALDTDVGKCGMGWHGLDVEDESRGESRVAGSGVAEAEMVGLDGIGGQQELAGSDGGEVVGFF